MKLDAKFYGQIRKVKDDSAVSDDEYVVFLAKDTVFATVAMPAYLQGCMDAGCDEAQIAAVRRMMGRMESWRAAHPGLLKVPDAKGEKLWEGAGQKGGGA